MLILHTETGRKIFPVLEIVTPWLTIGRRSKDLVQVNLFFILKWNVLTGQLQSLRSKLYTGIYQISASSSDYNAPKETCSFLFPKQLYKGGRIILPIV